MKDHQSQKRPAIACCSSAGSSRAEPWLLVGATAKLRVPPKKQHLPGQVRLIHDCPLLQQFWTTAHGFIRHQKPPARGWGCEGHHGSLATFTTPQGPKCAEHLAVRVPQPFAWVLPWPQHAGGTPRPASAQTTLVRFEPQRTRWPDTNRDKLEKPNLFLDSTSHGDQQANLINNWLKGEFLISASAGTIPRQRAKNEAGGFKEQEANHDLPPNLCSWFAVPTRIACSRSSLICFCMCYRNLLKDCHEKIIS